ncbi:DUF4227 family protein [Virgibacillus necropolis]|uniref:DUF4227 domain-containing protein n=1 Tax=Virgibacillus necropolis TaxID=163877 RepID=A0A221MCS3_9BACI|nr:DUF4227 family protein [Virgibacillus necropolis]ASN05455.1 hypothetical protein CFK40_10760 [Virgibacillus necropolis]
MKRMAWDTLKVFVIFIACTFLFYFGLRIMHAEYKEYHRYDPPEGPAVKVYVNENDFMDRFNLFFRLGE